MDRRDFLRASAFASVGLMTGASSAPAEIEITPQDTGPEINPHIYGQFIEHLGGVIYDGIWVGRNSKIPNIDGIRKQFVDDLKRIAVPNFRWPGGCFADGYHWRDGIGDPSRRPRTYNYWQASMPQGLDDTEPNHFGIHEFMNLCRLSGAEPYLAANMGSGSPQEFHDWVSYTNAPVGTVSLANERAMNGSKEPFGVRFWGVGNESWGCGGDMTPQEYASLYRRFVTQFPAFPPKPFLIAVGPRGHSKDLDLGWTNGFFEAMQGHRTRVDGLSIHYYTDFRNSPEKVSTFDARGWYDVIREGLRTETVIEQHWAAMGKFDPDRHTKLIVDEWGVWYRPGEEITPAYILSQPLTLRDALHTAVTFDVFNRHADKIAMANVAQTINCIHSLFLAQGDRFARTPVYYVFEMYRNHMQSKLAAMNIRADELKVPSRSGSATIPGLSGSASVREKTLTVTLTNPSLDAPVAAQIRLTSGSITEGKGTILTHTEMTAGNTLDRPNEIKLSALPVVVRNNRVEISIPQRAIVAMELKIT
ncbi:alpha-N-arabinofuranosidase [Edaphobacter aggregans]|uniref:non-reducing end alpha-L-arabinofuranosidase n=1 Tax=Edaphobacter aggregans TaxID=570835 RepID=A0A428MEL9_9BACT|nr:alpha-L-arabinofuranosidase C-terminal domain-containing protein [Edaphobacter aggregans]RSL15345.1 alpha-N-arabinofuranosidase [Edaphobacter aggregans]